MKLGILGTGMIVQDFMRTINDLNLEKVVIYGRPSSKEKTEKLCSYCNGIACYDLDEMLESDVDTIYDVDIIYNALPNDLHYEFSKKAIEHHKHVIIEKPVTANPKELEELIKLANQNQVMIFEAMNIPYMPTFLSLKEDVKTLGKIKIVSFNYSQYSSRYNAFKEGTILPAFDYHKAGGALMDLNVYNISAIVHLFGTPEKVQYMANMERNIDTSGILSLDYGSFKAVAIGAKDCKAPLNNTIQGDNGAIVLTAPLSQARSYTILRNDGTSEVKTFDETTHRMFYEFKEFIKMIETNDVQKANELILRSLSISQVMYQARLQNQIVFDNDSIYKD